MIAELTLGRLAPDDDRAVPRTWVVALAGAVRALSVGLSVVLLTCGLAVILWASAPDSTAGAASAIQAGVLAFAAAHLVPLTVAGTSVTLSPLLMTGAVVGLLAAVTRRARLRPVGGVQEVIAVLSVAAVYGLFVSVVARSFAPAGSVPPTAVLSAGGLALLAAAWGTAVPGSALRRWWGAGPQWLRLGARAGVAAALALLAAGALAVVAGLVLSFSSVAVLTGLAAPGVGAGLGLTVVQVTLLPNAAVAGVGYVAGVGFQLGAGHYSPFGSTVADLPGVPLLAAAPEGVAASGAGLLWLVVPMAVAVLVGRWVSQRTAVVLSRFLAVAVAALVAGSGLAVLALAARGGVQGGQLADTGAPAGLLAGVMAAGIAVIGGLTVLAHSGSGVRRPPGDSGSASGSARRGRPGARSSTEAGAEPGTALPVTAGLAAPSSPEVGSDDGTSGAPAGAEPSEEAGAQNAAGQNDTQAAPPPVGGGADPADPGDPAGDLAPAGEPSRTQDAPTDETTPAPSHASTDEAGSTAADR